MSAKTYSKEIEIEEKHAISEQVIIETIEQIENDIGDCFTKKKKRNLYTTISEIIQNVNNYTERDVNFKNKLEFIYNEKGAISINSSNLLNIEDKNFLEAKLIHIKSLNNFDMNKKYDEILHNGIKAKDRRNGLGTILIVKNTKQIDYNFEQISSSLYKFDIHFVF